MTDYDYALESDDVQGTSPATPDERVVGGHEPAAGEQSVEGVERVFDGDGQLVAAGDAAELAADGGQASLAAFCDGGEQA